MKFILLLAAFAAVNIEASPILVDTTKFLVLSGKSPYISLEITEMEDMFECYVVLKPMNGGDKINFQVYQLRVSNSFRSYLPPPFNVIDLALQNLQQSRRLHYNVHCRLP